ncbi:hypothetical protein DFH07DRAFT_830453 [Mycena maculata]|uniref:Uncharacterized protein n=1 Tax=Mycena maculata TaxID=230809 RepID=A0AAD7N7W5_9AGAR|nr:hypothetical protein DFH07DRAFT_830453 [Mycena maculata]
MFYVIYVLAILCRTVSSLQITVPGMVLLNDPAEVSWSHQHPDDLTTALMLLETVPGGGKQPVPNHPITNLVNSMSSTIQFTEAGSFRIWAVNPANESEAYAMSEIFSVLPDVTAMNSSPGNNSDGGGMSDPSHGGISSAPATTNMPVIIGAAIGGVVVLTILLLALWYILRSRKARVGRRTTFHRSLMVRGLAPPTFAAPPDAEFNSVLEEKDLVRGRHVSGSRFLENIPRPPPARYPFARTA